MVDIDLTRINNAIRIKKSTMINNQADINALHDYIQNIKRQIHNNNNLSTDPYLKSQMKKFNAGIKQKIKELTCHLKELKIYEFEYEKKRKYPNYRIDFDLLRKKHNKYNSYI